jgi:serine/threonine-protein kinase
METGLGHYVRQAELACGAVGAVWQAIDRRTSEPVAIKFLRPEAAQQQDLVDGFAAEAEILSELSHPGVVRMREFVLDGDEAALVMELIDGEDVRRRLRRDGPVPPAIAAHIASQVAETLSYLHQRGIVHGDVKPSNLLVPADGGPVRLADFGIARRLDRESMRATHATPEYVAPEVVEGEAPSPASDIYALGIALFELLTGRSPYRGGPPTQVIGRHATCRPVPPPGLPAIVWPLIEDCLDLDPAKRPAADLLAARLRGVEPALDGAPALPPLPADQVTWWPRPAGATVARAAAPIAWVPLKAAPVSPASAYAGRVVAVPMVHLDPVRAPSVPTQSTTKWPGLGPSGGASGSGQRPTPTTRKRRVWVAGGGAGVFVLAALTGGLLLAGGSNQPPVEPGLAVKVPAAVVPSAVPSASPATVEPGWTQAPTTEGDATAVEAPDLGPLPGIGDLMPAIPSSR